MMVGWLVGLVGWLSKPAIRMDKYVYIYPVNVVDETDEGKAEMR